MGALIQLAILEMKESLRQPSYLLSMVFFPSMFFLFFAVPNIDNQSAANMMAGSFAVFGVIGVTFFQFSIATATERQSVWERYLKSLPISSHKLFSIRLLNALFFSLLTALCVITVAKLTTPFGLSWSQWGLLVGVLVFGGLMFASFGLLLGSLMNAKNALPIANIFYLPLSFVGGLWMPPEILPRTLRKTSEWLPTRYFAEVVWQIGDGGGLDQANLLALTVFGLVCFVLYRVRMLWAR